MMERMRHFPGLAQAKDGRVQRDWQGLKPGRYRLQALCAGVAEPIVAIDAVEVIDGPCADPRLVDIDVRGRVRAFEIRATASDGTPITSRDAFVVIRSSGDDWCGFQLAAGFVKIAAPAAVDLIVVAKGHKAAFVNGVFDARTIALEAAPETHLALVLPSPLPEGAALQLRLKPTLELPRRARMQLDNGSGMGAESFFVEEAIVDALGKVTVPVRYPGPYTIEASLSFGQRGGTYIRDFEPRTITLPATGEVALRVGQKGFDRRARNGAAVTAGRSAHPLPSTRRPDRSQGWQATHSHALCEYDDSRPPLEGTRCAPPLPGRCWPVSLQQRGSCARTSNRCRSLPPPQKPARGCRCPRQR
jgi:hypothetical protein